MTAPSSDARYSLDELIDALGIDRAYGDRIWSAFGFAHVHSDAKMFTDVDLEAFRVFARGAAAVDESAQVSVARTIGQSLSRLAAWQADQLAEIAQDPDIGLSFEDIAKALNRIQSLVWRLHLAVAMEGKRSAHDGHTDWDTTIGFVDVVGYTSLSRRIDHHELDDLISNFETQVSDAVSRYDGQVIKTLGDGILFANQDPGAAASTALDIADLSDQAPIPRLRIGLAHGEVLARLGDVFGEPVNIAARLCGSARPGKILVDENLSATIEDDERFRLRSIPPLTVRGYRRLRAYSLSRPKKE